MNVYNLSDVDLNEIKDDTFALDTNVLYWVFYGNATYSRAYQKKYQEIISNLINSNHRLMTTTININELFNLVEKNNLILYNKQNGTDIKIKAYRRMKDEREKTQKELLLILQQISACMEIKEENFSMDILSEFANLYKEHKYDCFDFALVKSCCNCDINKIITDDKDFVSSQEKIKIYTLNYSALAS